jgi:hypothetical protein
MYQPPVGSEDVENANHRLGDEVSVSTSDHRFQVGS